MGRLFGTDGIRGVAGKDLNAELAMNIGKAAAAVLTEGCRRRPVFVIGTDTRISSDMLSAAVSAGLCSVGADVISLGVVPTPAVAYLVEKYKADAGVMISASHNTSEYNGIKIFSGDGFKLPDALEERIEDILLNRVNEPDCENGFLLDGFPRTIAQAEALEGIEAVDMAVNIDVPAEVLVDRISGRRMCSGCGAGYHISKYTKDTCEKCGAPLYIRDDDKPETVLNRISVYNDKTQPLIDFYDNKGLLKNVDGNRTPENRLALLPQMRRQDANADTAAHGA